MWFTVQQVARIRERKVTAALVSVRERARAGSVQPLRRRFVRRDGEGNPIGGTVTEIVTERRAGVDPLFAEPEPVLITILEVRELDVLDLVDDDARLCGYRTADALRQAWRDQHPRSPRAKLIRFVVGDVRDQPRYLSSIPFHHDYTTNAREAAPGEPEAIPEADADRIAAMSGQRFVRARADLERSLSRRDDESRLAGLERAATARRVDVRSELRIIEQRFERAERRAA